MAKKDTNTGESFYDALRRAKTLHESAQRLAAAKDRDKAKEVLREAVRILTNIPQLSLWESEEEACIELTKRLKEDEVKEEARAECASELAAIVNRLRAAGINKLIIEYSVNDESADLNNIEAHFADGAIRNELKGSGPLNKLGKILNAFACETVESSLRSREGSGVLTIDTEKSAGEQIDWDHLETIVTYRDVGLADFH